MKKYICLYEFLVFIAGVTFCFGGAGLSQSYEIKLTDIKSDKSVVAGNAVSVADGIKTTAISNKVSGIKFYTGMRIPSLTDNRLMHVEWTFVPLKLGKYGQDFRAVNGMFVVELNKERATFNTKFKSREHMIEGKEYTFSCDFNNANVYSWKINGIEQLNGPVSAWMNKSTELELYAVEWKTAQSETLWKKAKVSYFEAPADMLSYESLLHNWDNIPISKKDEQASFLTGYASPMVKVFREATDFKGTVNPDIIKIHSAGNERESFQIAVIPLRDGIKDLVIKPTELKCDSGKTIIPTSAIKVNPVGYVRTRNCNFAASRIGWLWPDVIMPGDTEVKLRRGMVQPYWCTVSVPDNTAAGRYRGFMIVSSADNDSRILRIELNVSDYSIPERGRLDTCFGFAPQNWDAWYKPEEYRERLGHTPNEDLWGSRKAENLLSKEKKRKLLDLFSDYRMSVTDIYASSRRTGRNYRTFPETPEEVEYYYKRGMKVMCLGYMDAWDFLMENPEKREAFLESVEKKLQFWDAFVKKHNWPDFTWIYHCIDESTYRSKEDQKMVTQFINQAIPRLKKQFPWLQFETANNYVPEYASLIDIWTSKGWYMDKNWDTYKKLISSQKTKIWAYTTCGSVHEANFLLDYPGINPRIMMWQLFQHKINGMLYFEIDAFAHQKNAYGRGVKWPECEWNPQAFNANSDGILLYPGPDAEPLASIRMANFRDGVEDYEALCILEELSEKLESKGACGELCERIKDHLKISSNITTSFTKYTHDIELLDDARKTTDELIEEAHKALGRD